MQTSQLQRGWLLRQASRLMMMMMPTTRWNDNHDTTPALFSLSDVTV